MGVGDDGRADEPSASVGAPSAAADAGQSEQGNGAADEEVAGEQAPAAGSGDPAVRVRVPESCAQTADDAIALVEQLDRVVAAVGDLDPERLRQTVDDAQQVRDEVRTTAEQCQEAAAQGQVEVTDAEGDDVEADDVEVDEVAPTTPAS